MRHSPHPIIIHYLNRLLLDEKKHSRFQGYISFKEEKELDKLKHYSVHVLTNTGIL